MSRPPPPTVEKLLTALHTKTKEAPDSRFSALDDKVYRQDVLEWADARCRANREASVEFSDVDARIVLISPAGSGGTGG